MGDRAASANWNNAAEDEALGKTDDTNQPVESVLGAAEANHVRVAALYGWSGRHGSGIVPRGKILPFVDAVINLSRSTKSKALAGLSFDIEPAENPNPQSYQEYADLLAEVQLRLTTAASL